MNLYRSGKLDASTALKMMADLQMTPKAIDDSKKADHPEPAPVDGGSSKKRERSPSPEHGADSDMDLDDVGAHLDS
eukprot:Skav235206  [mRNA]  locus=scaffold4495:120208:120435:- [translate_table: standard]